jgi:hypothetical protein
VVSFSRNTGYASGFDKDANSASLRSDDISTDQNSFFECVVGDPLPRGFSPGQQGTYQSAGARALQTYSIEGNMCAPRCSLAAAPFQCGGNSAFDTSTCPCRVSM